MPTIASNREEVQRRAWADYADRLRDLEGEEYTRAEEEAWEELQHVLADLGVAPATEDDPVG